MSVMLYKFGGKHEIDGEKYDWQVIDESRVEELAVDGWCLTTQEAKVYYEDDQPLTREELETKANELSIQFDGRTSDRKLENLIVQAMKGA